MATEWRQLAAASRGRPCSEDPSSRRSDRDDRDAVITHVAAAEPEEAGMPWGP